MASSTMQQATARMAKTVYFYKDGDPHFPPVKIAVTSRRYRSMDALLNDLNPKIPLAAGVRSIFTPGGRTQIDDVNQLQTDSNYICCMSARPKGLDLGHLRLHRPWHQGRPESSRRKFAQILKGETQPKRSYRRRRIDPSADAKQPKTLVVIRNGSQAERRSVLLNRRTSMNFRQVMESINEMFGLKVGLLYSTTGEKINDLTTLFNGSDYVIVCSPGERLQPLVPVPPRAKPEPQTQTRHSFRTKGRWRIYVNTASEENAGTQAQVTLTVYGERGESSPIPLGKPGGHHFNTGKEDIFEVSLGPIGSIYKIRIGHDNSGPHPGWLCEGVTMVDLDTNDKLEFICNQWMDRNVHDGDLCREIPVMVDGKPKYPVVSYELEVETGDLWNSGTYGTVFITLLGQRGDSGVRHLTKGKFQKGMREKFNVEAVSLGTLKRIIIGHDAAGLGNGWFLEQVTVKQSPAESWQFPCSRWLDEGYDDGRLVRELTVRSSFATAESLNAAERERWERLHWTFEMDNEVRLFNGGHLLAAVNDEVQLLEDELDPHGALRVALQRGMTRMLAIGHGHGTRYLAVEGSRLCFLRTATAACEFRIRPVSWTAVVLESVLHPRNVVARVDNSLALVRGSGPTSDRALTVYCKGAFRNTGLVVFFTSVRQTLIVRPDLSLSALGNHVGGKEAMFRVYKVGPGVRRFECILYPGKFLRCKEGRTDAKGEGDDTCHFLLHRHRNEGFMTLESVNERGQFLGFTLKGEVRPTIDTGEKNVRMIPWVIKFGIPKLITPHPPPEEAKQVAPEKRRKTPPPPPKQKKQRVPEKQPTQVAEEPPQIQEGVFTVELTSADRPLGDAFPSAQLFVVLYGEHGCSERLPLTGGRFDPAELDTYRVEAPELGRLYKARLELQGHADCCWKPGRMRLIHQKDEFVYNFLFDRWLGKLVADGEVAREAPAEGTELPILVYEVIVCMGSEQHRPAQLEPYVQLVGEHGDSGRRPMHREANGAVVRWEANQRLTFMVEAVDLGQLHHVTTGHSSRRPGMGIHLEQVLARVFVSTATPRWGIFPCRQWLDTGLASDGRTERVLAFKAWTGDNPPEEKKPAPPKKEPSKAKEPEKKEEPKKKEEPPPPLPAGDCIMFEELKYAKDAGPVTVALYGAKGKQEVVLNDEQMSAAGTEKATPIQVNATLGELYKIGVGRKVMKGQLKFSAVRIKHSTQTDRFRLPQGGALDVRDWREAPIDADPRLSILKYNLWLFMDVCEGGPELDAQINSSRGDSGPRMVGHPAVPYEIAAMDIEAVDLAELKEVTITHHSKGSSKQSGIVEKVVIFESKDQVYDVFQGGRPVPETSELVLPLTKKVKMFTKFTGKIVPSAAKEGLRITYCGTSAESDPLPFDETQRELKIGDIFKIRLELTPKEANATVEIDQVSLMPSTSTLVPLDFSPVHSLSTDFGYVIEAPSEVCPMRALVYKVSVYTSSRLGAGTDTNVYVHMVGENGTSGWRHLRHPSIDHFGAGSCNVFSVVAVDLGVLKTIKVKRDGYGPGSDWFLDKIDVALNGKQRLFVANCWVEENEDLLLQPQDK